jgi:hypothetical protein
MRLFCCLIEILNYVIIIKTKVLLPQAYMTSADLATIFRSFGFIALINYLAYRSEQNGQSLERTFHKCFLPSFSSFGGEVSEEKIKI